MTSLFTEMNHNQALKFLYSRERFGIKLGLSNIRKLLEKLDNPHKGLRVIHIAGTNGKGSVAAMLSSILTKQGYKVGLYTSPHLIEFEERIQINSKKISKKDVVRLVKKIRPSIKNHTYFEVITAIAFQYFKEKNIDFAVIEVGMGGRLDATNVVKPMLSVITNVSLEHTDHLGNKIEKIAYEKAGIIKKNVPVVTAAKSDTLKVIKKIAKKKKSRIYTAKKTNLKTCLKGEFQKINAGVAVEAVKVLRKQKIKISEKALTQGLKNTSWPGRLEKKGRIMLDCAHNPAGMSALKKEIKNKVCLILGISKDKDKKTMIKIIEPCADEIILTKADVERAEEPENLLKLVDKKEVRIIKSPEKALDYARKQKKTILVAGSIFVVGNIKKLAD